MLKSMRIVITSLVLSAALGCSETTQIAPEDAGDQDSTTAVDSAIADSESGDTFDSAVADTTSADTGSSPTDTGTADGGSDGMSDAAPSPIVTCGEVTCGAGEVCCQPPLGGMKTCTAGACPSGTIRLECDGPEDCPSSAPVCCAENADLTGSGFMCGFAFSGGTSCKASCPTSMSASCPVEMQRVRLCHGPSDCPESMVKNCCKFNGGVWTTTVCIGDGLIADNAAKCF
jgi:hypothetical protein